MVKMQKAKRVIQFLNLLTTGYNNEIFSVFNYYFVFWYLFLFFIEIKLMNLIG